MSCTNWPMNALSLPSSMAMLLSLPHAGGIPGRCLYFLVDRAGASRILARRPHRSHTQQCVSTGAGCAMNHLSSRDYADALRALAELEAAVDDAEAFALALALALRRFVLADGAALALMNRLTGQRLMVSLPVAVAVAVVLAPAAAAGDERVLALPLFTDGRSMVSLVLQRRGAGLSR